MTLSISLTALALTALLLHCIPMARFKLLPSVSIALFIALLVSLIPFGDLSLTRRFYSVTSDLSAASCVMTLLVLVEKITGQTLVDYRERLQFYSVIVLMGLALYPMALGIGPFDSYSLGFKPALLGLVCGGVAVLAMMLKNILLTVWLLVAGLAYTVTIYTSLNLWDYLIDPWVFLYGGFAVFYYLRKQRNLNTWYDSKQSDSTAISS